MQNLLLPTHNYYPFGLRHNGYNDIPVDTQGSKFKYNEGRALKKQPVAVFSDGASWRRDINDELGLDWYDFGARNYDAALGRWMNPDLLSEMYSSWSPYNYVLQNPIKFIDLNGLEPTPYEAALMAADIYTPGSVTLLGGWQQSYMYYWNENGNHHGLKGAMYERIKSDGTKEYAYVYAGTEDLSIDGYQDVKQAIGHSEQYDLASDIAIEMSEYLSSAELTFVGHSLGGGLSNYSSLVTGRTSITFNPAWLSIFSIQKLKKLDKIKELMAGKKRENYVHSDDPLNIFQWTLGLYANLRPTGDYKTVMGAFTDTVINGHFIETMINQLYANGFATQHRGNKDDKEEEVSRSPRDM